METGKLSLCVLPAQPTLNVLPPNDLEKGSFPANDPDGATLPVRWSNKKTNLSSVISALPYYRFLPLAKS